MKIPDGFNRFVCGMVRVVRLYVEWFTDDVLVPLLPLAFAAGFRWMKGDELHPDTLLWCAEVPFFTIVLSSTTRRRIRGLVSDGGDGVGSDVLDLHGRAGTALGLLGAVFLGVYYVDKEWLPIPERVRAMALVVQSGLAVVLFMVAASVRTAEIRWELSLADAPPGMASE